ncbi:hypothetical protein EN816_24245 [Mesorhizobium sp. M8A.F.Ca.ET.173.01.1.1]|nr:hypothetical protein EN816_24245 [Mesorhizobium sp. M8A.F.Ca.ET.173.01.1.1]
MAYRHVVEVSPLLTHMRGASDVSSHSSGAFPSGGFNLHTWPDLGPAFFLRARNGPAVIARSRSQNWAVSRCHFIGELETMLRAVKPMAYIRQPGWRRLT